MEAEEVTKIIHNSRGHTGLVTLTLTWNAPQDLDLWFDCKDEREDYLVYHYHKYVRKCDARLDIDMREDERTKIRLDGSVGQIENIYVNKLTDKK